MLSEPNSSVLRGDVHKEGLSSCCNNLTDQCQSKTTFRLFGGRIDQGAQESKPRPDNLQSGAKDQRPLDTMSLAHPSRDGCHQDVGNKVQDRRQVDNGPRAIEESHGLGGDGRVCEPDKPGGDVEDDDGKETYVAGFVGAIDGWLCWRR